MGREPVPWDELDPEIVAAVRALAECGVDTFSSCQGGEGHPGYGGMPTILFNGDENAGLWAVWLLETQGFRVQTLSRNWDLDRGLPREPFWRVTLRTLSSGLPSRVLEAVEGRPAIGDATNREAVG
jgi:hypothetical protein